jgi:hypothetical protein
MYWLILTKKDLATLWAIFSHMYIRIPWSTCSKVSIQKGERKDMYVRWAKNIDLDRTRKTICSSKDRSLGNKILRYWREYLHQEPLHLPTTTTKVARLFLVQHTKTGKNIYRVTSKYTKLPLNVPNGRKIFQISIKYMYTNIFHSMAL